MITENLSTLKINKLSQEQYDKALAEDKINLNEIYLTPDISVKYFNDVENLYIEDDITYIANEPISSLSLFYPNTNYICSIIFTIVDSGDIYISLPESKYIGKAPDFKNGETWELNIHNGIIASGKVVSE